MILLGLFIRLSAKTKMADIKYPIIYCFYLKNRYIILTHDEDSKQQHSTNSDMVLWIDDLFVMALNTVLIFLPLPIKKIVGY